MSTTPAPDCEQRGFLPAIRRETSAEDRRRYIDAMVGLVCDGIAAPKAG